MFSPSSGKLAYGRVRIGLIFSHYNAFGTPTQRNDHQGDTNYSFNRRIQNERISWNWKSSHSIIQTQIYDGQFFITASLADLYPTNIRICAIDSEKITGGRDNYDALKKEFRTTPNYCKEIVPGVIPGDGNGGKCG